ncbi:MAG: hydrolase [Paenibacillaceae bacterium]|nr:hydrolase [Paenibacillaceae bacterium]
MNLPYQLIALDVDGTLLTDDHVLTEGTKDAVRRCYEEGASIVLCTGRSPSNTFYLMEELGLKGILIAHNGGITMESEQRSVLHSFGFPVEELAGLLDYCRNTGIHYDANTVYDMYIDRITPREQDMYVRFGIRPIRVEDVIAVDEPILKFTLFGTSEDMDRVEREWAQTRCSMVPIRSGDYFIDVMHPQATKGNALKQLARSRQIPAEQVLAIGNYNNDTAMLQFAGLGIAMGNSPEAVKSAADLTTASNNEDGVRAALLKHVLQLS